jgi:cell wall-associated NlpC family hydrolase
MQPITPNPMGRRITLTLTTALLLTAAVFLLTSASAVAGGGLSTNPNATSGKPGKAKLVRGKALPPPNAPPRVVKAIKAANRIRKTKYVWGGGHGSFESRGYDCSGAVSYMLHGARMLKTPMTSGSLARWGKKRKGDWITVYANGGHTYAVVAGLRWDTSGGPGPRWHKDMRSRRGFAVRHFRGF